MLFLYYIHLRGGVVGEHLLDVVLVGALHCITLRCHLPDRVGVQLFGVAEVYLGQRGELNMVVGRNHNTLHYILERRQFGTELARGAVSSDINVLGICRVTRTCPSVTPNTNRVTLERTVRSGRRDVVVLAVERERLVVQAEGDSCHTDIVLRLTEANGYSVVVLSTGYTPREVNQGGVEEIVLYAVCEVVGSFQGEASTVHHVVAVLQFGFHVVFPDRYVYAVVAVLIGLLRFAVGSEERSIHIELDSLGGDVRAGIVNMSGHGERRDVLEVDIVRCE